ncbi:Dihydropteroate synthase [Acidilobus saccharovorans 345-15]|uniref:Dihydropteroate synthase n=1 Tax=Acidilobus saccharovorans (strain DSM 16705 / JCM 18335 / VKM B-2471 / 345-15) TaxID=666510 RepID=D9Q2X1_ACIS3|nr:dihydropteroate synthase [Acidilobus saccharovorans]ADL19659.1 Dihydropteroate synthase [Acidilobus saccharovorans 345-15]
MRVLLVVTGDASKFKDVIMRRVPHYIKVDFLEVRDLLFLDPEALRATIIQSAGTDYDYIIIPGSYPWSARLVGANVYKGPEGLGLLAQMLEKGDLDLSRDLSFEKYRPDLVNSMAREALESLRNYELIPLRPPPVRVLSEVVIKGSENIEDIAGTAKTLAADGADVIVLAPITAKAEGMLKDILAAMSDLKIALGLDARAEILSRFSSDFEVLLSLRPWQLRDLSWASGKYLVITASSNDEINLARSYVEHLVSEGVRPILDPVIRPPLVPGLWGSLQRLAAIRELNAPIMIGLSNAVELMDADTAGSAAMLTFISAELGASALLVEEASFKARGLTAEARAAADMASLSLMWLKPPKDVGVSLLSSKLKHGIIKDENFEIRLLGRDKIEVKLGSKTLTLSCRDRCPPKSLGAADPSLIIAVYRACLPWSSRWDC